MKKLRCVLDMDGAIVDFQRGIAKAFDVPFDWQNKGEWDCQKQLNLPAPWWSVCDANFWRSLDKMPDADLIINLIRRFVDEDQICVATSYPADYPKSMLDDCYVGKMEWLEEHYPFLTKHFNLGPSKHFFASPWSVLIDDLDHNVDKFIEEGGRAILIPRLWNRNHALSDGLVLQTIEEELLSLGDGYDKGTRAFM